jgi:hypothetical protein
MSLTMPIDLLKIIAVASLIWGILNRFRVPTVIPVRRTDDSAILDFKYENKYYRFREMK